MTQQSIIARVERVEPQVWTPKAKLYVSHEEGEITFAYPGFGPNYYKAVGKQILEKIPGKDLAVPTGDKTTSLLYATYCEPSVSNEPEFQKIKQIMKSSWLWVFNRNVFTENGVYILQDLEANGVGQLDVNELEAKLTQERGGIRFSEDGLVRFAPEETYEFGNHTPESLAEDGFIRASYGFKGAEKLGKVSAKFKNNPITYGINIEKGNSPIERVSAFDVVVGRLHVRGNDFGGSGRCRAFGVSE